MAVAKEGLFQYETVYIFSVLAVAKAVKMIAIVTFVPGFELLRWLWQLSPRSRLPS